MGFNARAYLADRERLLDPEPIHGTKSRGKGETSQAAKNSWFNSLTDADRERLREEAEQQYKNIRYE